MAREINIKKQFRSDYKLIAPSVNYKLNQRDFHPLGEWLGGRVKCITQGQGDNSTITVVTVAEMIDQPLGL